MIRLCVILIFAIAVSSAFVLPRTVDTYGVSHHSINKNLSYKKRSLFGEHNVAKTAENFFGTGSNFKYHEKRAGSPDQPGENGGQPGGSILEVGSPDQTGQPGITDMGANGQDQPGVSGIEPLESDCRELPIFGKFCVPTKKKD